MSLFERNQEGGILPHILNWLDEDHAHQGVQSILLSALIKRQILQKHTYRTPQNNV